MYKQIWRSPDVPSSNSSRRTTAAPLRSQEATRVTSIQDFKIDEAISILLELLEIPAFRNPCHRAGYYIMVLLDNEMSLHAGWMHCVASLRMLPIASRTSLRVLSAGPKLSQSVRRTIRGDYFKKQSFIRAMSSEEQAAKDAAASG